MGISDRLTRIDTIIKTGVDEKSTAEILNLMGVGNFPLETLVEIRLYSEVLPKAADYVFTNSQRYLHFLWDALDKSPICTNVNFAIPFRRMIARALFKKVHPGSDLSIAKDLRLAFLRPLASAESRSLHPTFLP